MKQAVISVLRQILPASVCKKIFHLGFNLDREEFKLFAHEYGFAPSMEGNLRKLADRGLQPGHIVDAGAFEGDWSRMARQIWPSAELTMVEANGEKQAKLSEVAKDVGATLTMALLGPESGREVMFHVMESGSSVLQENSPLARRTETLKMQRLDDLVGEGPVDLLKMDVQGFELEVLKGAPNILSSAQGILMEVSLIQINEGAPLMAEVVGFMADRGYEVCDVLEIHRRPLDRATNQVDLLFVPAHSPLMSDTRHYA